MAYLILLILVIVAIVVAVLMLQKKGPTVSQNLQSLGMPTVTSVTAPQTPCERVCAETSNTCQSSCPAPHANRSYLCKEACKQKTQSCQVRCRALG